MITVRHETPDDIEAVHRVEEAAFARPNEADAVDAVRRSGGATLSLVASIEDEIVGHIMFSPVRIETADGVLEVLGLAPLAVLPEYQRQGVGSMLTRAGLEECRALGAECVILLGHPDYYPRFGFELASHYGLRYPEPVPDEAFMVIELKKGCLAGRGGLVHFLPEWEGV